MQQAQIRDYKRKPLVPEVQDKLERSYRESLDLSERELRCPHCNYYILSVFSDVSGHFKAKCNNCKTISIFNLGYFRRFKRYDDIRHRKHSGYRR